MIHLPPHVKAQLDPAIDNLADALGALHTALSALVGAARADLDPDTAETAFMGFSSGSGPNSVRNGGRRRQNTRSPLRGLRRHGQSGGRAPFLMTAIASSKAALGDGVRQNPQLGQMG